MLRKRTLHVALLAVAGAGVIVLGAARSGPVGAALAHQMDATPAATTEEKIADAMGAAPSSVSAEATILDYEMDADGKPAVLREGSNGWTCFPDTPGTPLDDPMCLDQTFMGWAEALMTNTEPNTKDVGLAYMLKGAADPSNTDPFATEPKPGEDWVMAGPHVMIIAPGKFDMTVFSADPDSGKPWIMFAGTPFEHIMMPVTDREQ